MSFNVLTISTFDRQVKRLSKKYPSLKKDLLELSDKLALEPEHGIAIGDNFYKIRIAISSKNKGKSGGARVITYLKVTHNTVYLTSIFDKSDKISISDSELKEIFKMIP